MDYKALQINRESDVPMYRQLYMNLRGCIESGEIAPCSVLPKIRDLARELGIARNTVEAAYRQLSFEGYTHATRGVGHVVEDFDFTAIGRMGRAALSQDELPPTLPQTSVCPTIDPQGCAFDFSYGNRALRDQPLVIVRKVVDEALASNDLGATTYIDPFGLPGLRAQLAQYLATTRGVHASAEQVVLMPGMQPMLQHIACLFEPSERRAVVDEPGYPGAFAAFSAMGCRVSFAPSHRGAQRYLSGVAKSKAKLVYVTPSNQFPFGHIMTLSTRVKLIEWARAWDAYVVEDDYCCEFRYGNDPVPSLQSLDPTRVIYLGTVSKTLSPAMRICYGVLPMALVRPWREAFFGEPCALSWLDQEILHRLLAEGYWNRYIAATAGAYKRRHDVLIGAIDKHFGDKVSVIGGDAGQHILLADKRGRDQKDLVRLAMAQSVRVYETNPFWSGPERELQNCVLVGFSAIEEEKIDEGIRRLAAAWA